MRTSLTRTSVVLATTAAIAVAGVAGTAVTASAATPAAAKATCTVTPTFPTRFAFAKDQVTLKIKLKIVGPAVCHKPEFIDVSTWFGVKKSSEDQYFLAWTKPNDVNSRQFYASLLKPGRQRFWQQKCTVENASFQNVSCTVKPHPSYVWKFKGATSLTATRSGSKVNFTVHTRRYKPFDGLVAESTGVQLQRKAGKKWVLVHKARTSPKGVATFTVTRRAKATYRVVSAATRLAFGATSKHVTK